MLKYVGNSALMDDIGPVMYETPVNYCYAVKCDKCGKTTWKVGFVRSCDVLFTTHRSIGRAAVPTLSPFWQGSKRRIVASVLGDSSSRLLCVVP